MRAAAIAKGVLVVLRGCDAGAAFEELVAASRRHRLPIFTLADAPVAVAGNRHRPAGEVDTEVAHTVEQEWGPLLPPRAGLAE